MSGTKPRHGNLAISAGFSNFDAMCTLAQSDSKNNGFRNVGSGGDNRLLPGSYAACGFSSSFSDGYELKKPRARCHITVTSPGYLDRINPFGKLAFWCSDFEKDQVNERWSTSGTFWEVLKFFITRFRFCINAGVTTSTLYKSCMYGPNLRRASLTETGGPVIGPLQYFGNPAIVILLKDEPDMTPFGEGLLLKLTEDFTTVDTVEIDDRLHAIRSKLRNAGFKTLDQGIDRSQWGCGSESVLGDEQP